MKSIFEKYKILGFDFDNTLADVDHLHMIAWTNVLKQFEISIDLGDFFIHEVNDFNRYDNPANVLNSIFNNLNVKPNERQLIQKHVSIRKMLANEGLPVVRNRYDLAEFFCVLKNYFLKENIKKLSKTQAIKCFDPFAFSFINSIQDMYPNMKFFIATTTSSKALRLLLEKVELSETFPLVIGEEEFRSTVTSYWGEFDKSSLPASQLASISLKKNYPKLVKKMLYIGDDSTRDFLFAKNIKADYIQIKNKPLHNEEILFFDTLEKLTRYIDRPFVKVCRVESIHVARYLARIGSDLVGLHFIDGVPKDSRILNHYKLILGELKKYYSTKSVMVTRSKDPKVIQQSHRLLETDFIQLHSDINLRRKINILKDINCFGQKYNLINVVTSGNNTQDILGENILIDKSYLGGTGKTVDKDKIKKIIRRNKEKFVFLAGGVNAQNVEYKIKKMDISAVDVQSSLENKTSHKKDIKKIKEFFEKINREHVLLTLPYKTIVSVSLQPQELGNKPINLDDQDVDIVHADYSDGVSVEGWKVKSDDSVKYWAKRNPFIPLDVHMFSVDQGYINKTLSFLESEHPQVRTIFFYIRSHSDFNKIKKIVQKFKILSYGISLDYDSKFSEKDLSNIISGSDEILICLPEKNSKTWEIDSVAYQTVLRVERLKIKIGKKNYRIGIDRDVNLPRVSLFSKIGVTHFVVGKFLYNSQDLARSLMQIRSRSYEK